MKKIFLLMLYFLITSLQNNTAMFSFVGLLSPDGIKGLYEYLTTKNYKRMIFDKTTMNSEEAIINTFYKNFQVRDLIKFFKDLIEKGDPNIIDFAFYLAAKIIHFKQDLLFKEQKINTKDLCKIEQEIGCLPYNAKYEWHQHDLGYTIVKIIQEFKPDEIKLKINFSKLKEDPKDPDFFQYGNRFFRKDCLERVINGDFNFHHKKNSNSYRLFLNKVKKEQSEKKIKIMLVFAIYILGRKEKHQEMIEFFF